MARQKARQGTGAGNEGFNLYTGAAVGQGPTRGNRQRDALTTIPRQPVKSSPRGLAMKLNRDMKRQAKEERVAAGTREPKSWRSGQTPAQNTTGTRSV